MTFSRKKSCLVSIHILIPDVCTEQLRFPDNFGSKYTKIIYLGHRFKKILVSFEFNFESTDTKQSR